MGDTQAQGAARSYRERTQQGTLWLAPSGNEIRIRKLNLADYTIIDRLPDHLQQRVYAIIDASGNLKGDAADDDPFEGLDGKGKLDTMRDLSIRFAKVGWIAPRLVDTVNDPDTEIGVDEIDTTPELANDLIAYLTMVFSGNYSEAQQVATFPGQPAGGVGAGLDGSTLQPTSERHAGVAGSGDIRPDAV